MGALTIINDHIATTSSTTTTARTIASYSYRINTTSKVTNNYYDVRSLIKIGK